MIALQRYESKIKKGHLPFQSNVESELKLSFIIETIRVKCVNVDAS